MLCIGFGRWPPQNVTEVWVTIVSMLIGASLYAMFIGHISNLIHSVTTASRSYNEKVIVLSLLLLHFILSTTAQASGRIHALQKAPTRHEGESI